MSEPPSTGRGVGSRGGRGRGRQPGRRGSGGAGRAGNAGSQAAGLPEWQAPYVWACPTCTFFNETQPHRCEMCGTPNAERPWPGGGAASGGGGGAAAEGRGGGLSRRALQAKSRREAAAALLNFRHAAPPPGASSAAVASPPVPRRPAGRPFSRGADHHNPAVSSPALSKLHFLQANFHLLCAAGSSLTRGAIHSATGRSAIAAAAAAWEECRAVRLAATHALQCPVCLVEGPPAAHVGSCGHVICLPCALRLFALAREEDRLSRCPICAEILLLADLRSVVLLRVADARTGESIVFRKLFLGGEGGDAGREARASGGEGGASALSAAAAPFVPSVAGAMLATPAGATHTLHTAAPVPAAMVATALPTPALTTPALANTAAAAAASPSTDAAGNTPAAAPDARSPGTAGAPPPTADAPVIGSPTFAPPAPPRGPLYPDYESVPPVIATGASSVASFRSLLDASLDELRTQEAAIWEEARISAEVASAVAHAARADATTPGGRPSVPSGRGGAGEAKSGAGIAKSGAREAKSGCNEAKSSAGETRSGSAWGAGGLPDVGSPNYRSREPGVPPVGVPGEFPTTPNIANRWAAGGGARLAGALAPPPPPPPAPAAVSWPGDERLLRAAAASAAREAAWAARGGAAGGGGGGGDGGGAAAEGAGGGGVLSPEQEEDVRYIRLAVKEMQARRRAWETQDGNGPDRNGRDRNDADRNGRDRNGTDRNGRDRNRHERNGQDRNSHRRGERAGVAAAAALPPRAVEGGARVAKGERMAGGSGVGRRAESAGGMAGAAGEGLAEKVGMAGGVGLASADAGMPRMKSENRTAEARGTLGAGGVAGSGVGSGADGGASLRAGGDASNASDGGVACTGASDGSAVDASSGVASAPESTTEGRYALQDASGAFLFADPLSVRMLLEQHGSWSNLPDEIEAEILEIRTLKQDEASRRRYKHTSHLPTGCSFKLTQLELTRGPSAVGAPAAASFGPELAKRAARRRSEAQADRRASAAAAEEERALRATSGGRSMLAVEVMARAGGAGGASPELGVGEEPPSITPTSDWHLSWQKREQASTGPSFRLMVQMGYAAAGTPPSLSPFGSPSAGPSHPAASPGRSSHSSPRTSAGGYTTLASPPIAPATTAAPAGGFVLSGGGGGVSGRASAANPSSMLHGATPWCVPTRGATEPAPPLTDDGEAPPPDLAASWAAAPVAPAKGKKGKGVVLLSNGGGRRP